jgi:OOP family OmpA-OmpF porin
MLALTERVDDLETMLIDTDQDGVADYLDLEKIQFLV